MTQREEELDQVASWLEHYDITLDELSEYMASR